MKLTLTSLLLLWGCAVSFAQSDPTRRLDKNLRANGALGFSEAGLTRQDSLAIWQAISTGLASSTGLSATVTSLSTAIGGKVAQSEFNTYKTNAAIAKATQDALIGSKLDSITYRAQIEQKLTYLTNVESFSVIDRGNVTSFAVQGSRGGQFEYKPASASLAVDNGVVFRAKDGGYLVRQYEGELQAKWWGATGDGVADEYPAIQAALNYAAIKDANSLEGRVVRLTKYTHKLSRMPIIPKYVRLVGEGSYTTELVAMPGFVGSALVQLGDSLQNNNPAFGTAIERCKLNCNSLVPIGVYSQKAQEEAGVYNCIIINPTSKGILFRGDVSNAYVAEAQIRNTHVWLAGTATHGIDIQSCRVFVHNVTVLPLQNPATSLTNIRIFGNSYSEIQGSHFENYDKAISVEGGARAVLTNNSGGNSSDRNAGGGGRLIYIESGQGAVTINGAEHLDANGYTVYDNATNGMKYDVATYGNRTAFYVKSDYTRQTMGNIGISGPWRTSGPERMEAPENTVAKYLNGRPLFTTSPNSLSNHIGFLLSTRYTAQGDASEKWNVGTYSPASGGDGTKLRFSRLSGSWADILHLSASGVEIQGGTYNNPHLMVGNLHVWTDGIKLYTSPSAPTGSSTGTLLGDMSKSVYDADNDNVVDNALNLSGQPGSYYTNRANQTGAQSYTTITGLGSAATLNAPVAGDAASAELVRGSDSRLTNARTPTPHTHTLNQITDAGGMAAQSPGSVTITGGSLTGVSLTSTTATSDLTLSGANLLLDNNKLIQAKDNTGIYRNVFQAGGDNSILYSSLGNGFNYYSRGNGALRARLSEEGRMMINKNDDAYTRMQIGGSLSLPLVVKTAAYTITNNDYTVVVDASSSSLTVTLPTAVGVSGRVHLIKRTNAGSNAVTINGTSAQTIDASATYTLSAQNKYVQVQSDGNNWIVIGNN